MSVERNKEEIKEEQINGVALSDEELEKVSGGSIPPNYGIATCSNFECPLCPQNHRKYNPGKPRYLDISYNGTTCIFCGAGILTVQ